MTDRRPFEQGRGALRGGSVRLYAAPKGQARVRRATDVVLLAPSALALALAIVLYPPSTTEQSLERLRVWRPPRIAVATVWRRSRSGS